MIKIGERKMETVESTDGIKTGMTPTGLTSVEVETDVAVEAATAKVNHRKGPRKTDDPSAPYGRKADGTPRGKPGRRSKSV